MRAPLPFKGTPFYPILGSGGCMVLAIIAKILLLKISQVHIACGVRNGIAISVVSNQTSQSKGKGL